MSGRERCEELNPEIMSFGVSTELRSTEVTKVELSCCPWPWNHSHYQPLVKLCPQLWRVIHGKGRKNVPEEKLVAAYCEGGLDRFVQVLEEHGHKVLVEKRGKWPPALYSKIK